MELSNKFNHIAQQSVTTMDLKFLANSDGEQAATTHGLAKDTLKAHRVSVTQNYCKCQTPLYEKKQVAFK